LTQRAFEITGQKGLDQMFQKSGLLALRAVGGTAPSAHRDRKPGAIISESFEQGPTVTVRQSQIGQQHIARLGWQIAQCFLDGLRRVHLVPRALQKAADIRQRIRVILDEKNAHQEPHSAESIGAFTTKTIPSVLHPAFEWTLKHCCTTNEGGTDDAMENFEIPCLIQRNPKRRFH
jgi:glutamate/tyrosine decarboxylase-like PLP-dependent enzyme